MNNNDDISIDDDRTTIVGEDRTQEESKEKKID